MKKSLSILLITIFLVSTTELSQLLKTPLLIEHFIKHKKENAELSFIGFLELHYFNGNPHDEDYDQDMRLPFKAHNHSVNLLSLDNSFLDYGNEFVKLYPKEIKKNLVSKTEYSSRFLHSIWQPPKNS